MSGVAIGALLVTALVVARQLLTVRENVRLLADTAARQNEARFRSLVQHSSDVIMVTRPNGTMRFVSPSASRVFGYEPAALLGRPIATLLHPADRDRATQLFAEVVGGPGVIGPVEWRFRQADGSWLHAEILATNLLGDPTVRGIVLNTRDVSERKRLEEQLTHQAFHDPAHRAGQPRPLPRPGESRARPGPAAGTPDHRALPRPGRLQAGERQPGSRRGRPAAIAAAERFQSCARAADTVSRLGGDEFAILIEHVAGSDGRPELLQRLEEAMTYPFALSGNQVQVSASIGVATAIPGDTADDLLRNADVAMYAAKRRGKGRSETYELRMYADVRERLEMEAALRTALETDQLSLHYQPIVSLKTGALYGIEALVRWDHPTRGHLLPQSFITLAEETGLIVPLGAWVLTEACRQVQEWRAAFPETPLCVSVNISGRQLQGGGVTGALREALAATGASADGVVLEITESVLMQQTDTVQERLWELKSLGVRLAIDDFGTGYSSLSYLQRFPIDILKIAKPFVDDVGSGTEKSALARAIVGLGETLKLRTIAEGIERGDQRAALLELGCDLGQGHYFSRALPPDGIARLLTARRAAAERRMSAASPLHDLN